MPELAAFAGAGVSLALLLGLLRLVWAPTAADRLLAVQLIGTAGIGMLMLLALWLERTALIDVALVLALLAAVAAAAFAARDKENSDG